jgi:hypothetical protein
MAGEMANLVDYFTGLGREQGAMLGEDVPSFESEVVPLARSYSDTVSNVAFPNNSPLDIPSMPIRGARFIWDQAGALPGPTVGEVAESVTPLLKDYAEGFGIDTSNLTVLKEEEEKAERGNSNIDANKVAEAKAKGINVSDKVSQIASKNTAVQVRNQLEERGASQEALSGWDKFNEDYDLSTIGLALMANQGGDLFSNLAQAMILGKQAKTAEKDKAAATAAAGRKEAREEREIRRKEADTASQLEVDKAKYNKLLAEIDNIKKGDPDDIEGFFTNKAALESITSFLEGKVDDPEGDTLIIATDADDIFKRARAADLEGFSAKDALDMALKRRIAADPSSRDIPGVPFM